MDFYKVIPYRTALAESVKHLEKTIRTITLPLTELVGKRLAADVISPENLPAFDRSTVDGWAVRAAETYGATAGSPVILNTVGKVIIGQRPPFALDKGKTAYIPTGGALPVGADAAVMLEHSDLFGEDVLINAPVRCRENVIACGDDVKQGEILLKKGSRITPLAVGVLAGVGITSARVYAPVRFYVISTGDELCGAEETPSYGAIRDVNTYSLSAAVTAIGGTVCGTKRVKDAETDLKAALLEAARSADVILISGGSSVGEKDYTYRVFRELGEEPYIKGIALKPGKPTIAGTVCGIPAFGLPGHPFAAFAVFRTLITEALFSLWGARSPFVTAVTACNFPSAPGRTTFQPVTLTDGEDGRLYAAPLFGKSGLAGAFCRADGLAMLEDNAEGADKGQTIRVIPLE